MKIRTPESIATQKQPKKRGEGRAVGYRGGAEGNWGSPKGLFWGVFGVLPDSLWSWLKRKLFTPRACAMAAGGERR